MCSVQGRGIWAADWVLAFWRCKKSTPVPGTLERVKSCWPGGLSDVGLDLVYPRAPISLTA